MVHLERGGLQVVRTGQHGASLGHPLAALPTGHWAALAGRQREADAQLSGEVAPIIGTAPRGGRGDHSGRCGADEAQPSCLKLLAHLVVQLEVHEGAVPVRGTVGVQQADLQAGVQAVLADVQVLGVGQVQLLGLPEDIPYNGLHGLVDVPLGRGTGLLEVTPSGVQIPLVDGGGAEYQRLLHHRLTKAAPHALYRRHLLQGQHVRDDTAQGQYREGVHRDGPEPAPESRAGAAHLGVHHRLQGVSQGGEQVSHYPVGSRDAVELPSPHRLSKVKCCLCECRVREGNFQLNLPGGAIGHARILRGCAGQYRTAQ